MERIEKMIQLVIKWGTSLATIVMGVVMIMVVFTALGRLVGFTVAGTFDVVETFMMVVGAFCLVYCESQGGQAKAEVVTDRVSPAARTRLAIVTSLLTFAYWGMIFYAGGRMLLDKFGRGERTDLLGVNVLPSRTVWVVSVVLMCLLIAFRFFRHVRDAVRGEGKGANAREGVSK